MGILEWIISSKSMLFSSIPAMLILLFAAGLIISAVGFIRLVYFISIGYGLSVAGMAIISVFVFGNQLAITSLLHGGLLSLYGLRLGIFLWKRETQTSYKKEQNEIQQEYPGKTLVRKLIVWIGVSFLYMVMVTPLVFHLEAAVSFIVSPAAVIGLVIGFSGLIIETIADFQKSSFKKKSPSRFCDKGLYKIVRSPNYFGEILVWVGSFTAAIPFYGTDVWRWIFALAGLIVIVLIMLGSAKRLEEKQIKRYGNDNEFTVYCSKTPVLFPLIPIKSLKKLRVYLG